MLRFDRDVVLADLPGRTGLRLTPDRREAMLYLLDHTAEIADLACRWELLRAARRYRAEAPEASGVRA